MDDLDSGQVDAPDLPDNPSGDTSDNTPIDWESELQSNFDKLSTDDDEAPNTFETPVVPPEDEAPTPDAENAPQEFNMAGEWSDDEKTALAALPPETQTMLNGKFEALNEAATYKAEISGLIPDSLKQELEQSGLSDAQGLSNLMSYYQQAQSDPVAHILGIANQFGIDIGQNGQEANQEKQEFDDPQMAGMQQQIDDLATQNQQYIEQQQAQENTAAGQMISEFSTAKSEDGQLSYPHFEAVKSEMGDLFQTNPNISLKDAYDKAIWSNSETRQQLLNADADKKAKASEKQAAFEADKAKKAAKIINTNSGKTNAPPQSYDNTEDAVRAAAKKIGFTF